MAGLIDNKTRVLDAKLTLRGKQSLAEGNLRVKYVSFSDAGAVYEDNGNGVAVDPLGLGFEAFSTPNDEITLTTDEFGDLNYYESDIAIVNRDGTVTGIGTTLDVISSGSILSLENQKLISTKDVVFNDEGLSASPSSLSFIVNDEKPFKSEPAKSSINDIESLFADKRFGKALQFQYLPPVQRTISTIGNEISLGQYTNLRENDLNEDELLETISNLDTQTITFSKYTSRNEICIQFFESSSAGLTKLDIVKYGQLETKTPEGKQQNLYFIGKVYEDGFGNPTFVNLFDLVTK